MRVMLKAQIPGSRDPSHAGSRWVLRGFLVRRGPLNHGARRAAALGCRSQNLWTSAAAVPLLTGCIVISGSCPKRC